MVKLNEKIREIKRDIKETAVATFNSYLAGEKSYEQFMNYMDAVMIDADIYFESVLTDAFRSGIDRIVVKEYAESFDIYKYVQRVTNSLMVVIEC